MRKEGPINEKGDGVKIMVFLGSPRKKGNSATLADQLIKGAKNKGAEVDSVYLNGLDIGPCQGCGKCRSNSSSRCAIKDDMHNLYAKLETAEAIVIVSPVYFFNFSAQTKIFIDRCYALGNSKDFFKGKVFALLLTYADSDLFNSGAINVIRTFQDMCGYLNASIAGMVYGSADKAGEIEVDVDSMNKAFQLGEKLTSH